MPGCDGSSKADSSQEACSNWCKYLQHCAWCKCKACDFCGLAPLLQVQQTKPSEASSLGTLATALTHSSAHPIPPSRSTKVYAPERSFPSSRGHWDCSASSWSPEALSCDGKPVTDFSEHKCSTWCKLSFASTHCQACKCKACSFCVTSTPTWKDDERSKMTAASPASTAGILRVLSHRWLLLIGDSSVRMLFHFMMGILTLGWQKWPRSLWDGRGPELPPTAWLAALQGPPCLDRHEDQCMEDAHFADFRMTCLWTDFGDVKALGALERLAGGASPDGVIVGVGAWWVWHRPTEGPQYEIMLQQLLAYVDRMFPSADTARVFAATTSCGRKEDGGDERAHVATRFNGIAEKQVLATSYWRWFDRDVVTGRVCRVDSDCAGTQFTSRFHPAGDALNVLLTQLLGQMSLLWTKASLPDNLPP